MHIRLLILCTVVALAAGIAPVRAADAPAPFSAASVEFFEKKIRPMLIENCYECHSADTNSKGGLRVDDRNGLIMGGGRGPAVAPGMPEDSLLIKAVMHTHKDVKMPPKKQLADEQIADLVRWIKDGVAWPADPITIVLGKANPKYEKLRREHWAWQPLKEVKPPQVKDESWARDDIDRYILSALEAGGMKPATDATRVNLIRRVTFDLTGLPPTPQEIDAFVDDSSSGALERVVDRLLASPAFGERWGRHWLDVARYGESTGPSRNVPYPHAWRYRDYVIDAFNKDKPYDQFIREQIAGDLLPAKDQTERDEHTIATGFLAIGQHDVNQRFKVRFVMENIDEQIDTMSRSVLALTAGCARCHDHKFDPIPTSDYYALAGIFYSTDECDGLRNKMGGGGMDYYDTQMLLHLGPEKADPTRPAKVEQTKKELAAARADLEKLKGKEGDVKGSDGKPLRAAANQKVKALEAKLFDLNDPASDGLAAIGVREARKITDTEIRIRGEAERLGPVVPRGFFGVVQFADEPVVDRTHSGRLELAEWLTSDKNPLTSRVMANRIWEHLFGQGLVRTVDNFGTTGDVPSNLQLLDHLASRFVHEGWSVKKLIRDIVLTRAYQLGSGKMDANMAVDPADRLVWRHNPRRLEAEEIRDATLAAAGTLDTTRPDASPAKTLKVMEMVDNGAEAARITAAAKSSLHRSVYLPLVRGLTPTSLEVFDFAQQGMVTGSRDATTVATQALYLLNDPFVRRQSLNLAQRLLGRDDLEDAGRIDLAYRLTLGRSATSAEIERAKAYVSDFESAAGTASVPEGAVSHQAVAVADVNVSSAGESGASNAAKKAAPVNPDQVVHRGADPKDEEIHPATPKAAAWASFCQVLLGTVEFRFLK